MGDQVSRKLTALLSMIAAGVMAHAAFAQDDGSTRDSLVRLVKGASLELIEKDGVSYRKAVDATFLHNGTYLICDTALWNVDSKVINAEGHVQIIQDETVLTSDKLDYLIDDNLACFRGTLVQLQDKDSNTLRTRYLDYNTRDSTAYFQNGGSMRSHDGQIIESLDGSYDSHAKLFNFRRDVNMFTDSVFIKTENMDYDTVREFAYFKSDIDFWKDGNMLSAGDGWYNHGEEIFFFTRDVHATTEQQETWSDSLYYYRTPGNVTLLGNAQVQDTTRNVFALANYIFYEDSLSRVTMERDAAVAIRTGETPEKYDTLYFGADSFVYHTVRRCDIPDNDVREAGERLKEITTEAVEEYRRKAAEEAAAAAEKARQEAEESGQNQEIAQQLAKAAKSRKGLPGGKGLPGAKDLVDSLATSDSLAVSDSLTVAPSDSLAVAPDTTKIGFLTALHNVKAFRKDIQVKADSLLYCDLDSIARFYIDPVVWNEGNRQYSADSIFLLVRGNGVDRASLMSNAFIVTQEPDTVHYDQIKSTEVMAYFDSTSALRRFDALGGVNAMFYLKEKEKIGTVNKVDAKMLSAVFKDAQIDRVFYFDAPKNDAYPVVQLPPEDHFMRGFSWQDDLRPASPDSITSLKIRPSEREEFESRPRTTFNETKRYFPGYMESVYAGIAERDSLEKIAAAAPAVTEQPVAADTLKKLTTLPHPIKDSLARRDSVAASDTLKPALDSLSVSPDTLSVKDSLTAFQRRRAERLEKREAKWKALDERDKARQAAKEEKKKARLQKRELMEAERMRRQEIADSLVIEKYKRIYERQKAVPEPASGLKIEKKLKIEDNGENSEPIPPLRVNRHAIKRGE